MLVLSRKKNESIVVGQGDDRVEFTVIEIRGDKVRLGIVAPRQIPVHRKEIQDRIDQADEAAALEADRKLSA